MTDPIAQAAYVLAKQSLPAAGLPGALGALGAGAPTLYNPSGLRRFRAALDGAMLSVAHVVCVGDSRTEGVGVDSPSNITDNVNSDLYGYPGVMRTLFARQLGVPEGGCIYPSVAGTDSRVTLSGATADSSTDAMQKASRVITGQTITYSVPSSTTIEILCFNDANITGTFSYSIDGGTAVNVTAAQADADGNTTGPKRFVVSGLSQTAHSVVITGTSAAFSVQYGIRYHSGTGICVSRRGRAGYTVLDAFGLGAAYPGNNIAVGNAPAAARMLSSYGAWGSSLTTVHFDYNDWLGQTTTYTSGLAPTPAIFQQYLQTMVNQIVSKGGCALLVGGANSPSATTPAGGLDLTAYWAAIKTVATSTDHCSAIILSEYWGSAADGVALGLNSASNSIHPSRKGYGSFGRMLWGALNRAGIFGV